MSKYPTRDIAERYERRFVRTFTASVRAQRRLVTDEMVARVMARGLTDEPRELYDVIDQIEIAKGPARDRLTRIFARLLSVGARLAAKIRGLLRLNPRLSETSPHILEAAARLSLKLIEGVGAESKAAIRQIVFESLRDGLTPADAAGRIRDVVGLTQHDAVALQRFRDLTATTDQQAAAYADKLLARRAETIARTETTKAVREGQQEAWRAMARDPSIDTTRFTQRWQVTPDDLLCELCAPMDGQEVPLDVPFTSSVKGVLPSEWEAYAGMTTDGPPLHPNCRCELDGDFGE